MRLESELKAVGCNADAATFQDTLADIYNATLRDCSVDNFLCRPHEHRGFCEIVRFRFRLDETADEMILRRLLNMRKDGQCVGPKAGSRQSLKLDLDTLGIEVTPEEFRGLLEQIFVDVYKGFTVDQLLMRWRDSVHFCSLVCGELGVTRDPVWEDVILRALLNFRRRGFLSLRSRQNGATA